eukprot:gnl/MRDRNA2_/MRDRNA2_114633_c0_seq1.p1 gnl/MRDRNA2_/MRDRNA2_114633_c0~~gnl/MRDRNA2_/MRDRNA2_114633_c0_seq1.p1  ORF type:complete len:380 (+),score=62.51 gnl/MRDRNA2_/MRDRNA2_114633_c0_seq1:169-1308(+)
MAALAIFTVVVSLICADALNLQDKVLTMGHGQHKKKKRSSSYKANEKIPSDLIKIKPSHKASTLQTSTESDSAFQAHQSKARNMVTEGVQNLIAEVIFNSNMTKDEKMSLLELQAGHKVKWPPFQATWSDPLPNALFPYSQGGPLSHYLDNFGTAQIKSMQAANILDKYYRWNENFLTPPQWAFYNFILGSKAYNPDYILAKYQVISIYCSYYAITTCPFKPGEKTLSQVMSDEQLMKQDLLVADGPQGTFLQSPEFEKLLILGLKAGNFGMSKKRYERLLGDSSKDSKAHSAYGMPGTTGLKPWEVFMDFLGQSGLVDPASLYGQQPLTGDPALFDGGPVMVGAETATQAGYQQYMVASNAEDLAYTALQQQQAAQMR